MVFNQQQNNLFKILICMGVIVFVVTTKNYPKKQLTQFFKESDLVSSSQKSGKQYPSNQDKPESPHSNPASTDSLNPKLKIKKLLQKLLVNKGLNSLDSASSKTILNFLKSNKQQIEKLRHQKTFEQNKKKLETHKQDTKNFSNKITELNRKMFLARTKMQELQVKGSTLAR